MQWTTEDRLRLLGKLAGVDRVLSAGYRFLLGVLIAAIVAVAAAVVVTKPFGAAHQGEWFYFGCIVLLALGWAVKEFVKVSRRIDRFKAPISLLSTGDGGARTWELRWGSPPADGDKTKAPSFGIQLKMMTNITTPLSGLRPESLPDESALRVIRQEVERGVRLEDAILMVQPEFSQWSPLEQYAYGQYVAARLKGQPA